MLSLAHHPPTQAQAQPADDGPQAEEDLPQDPLALIEEANEAARKRRYKDAVPKYKDALQLAPDAYPSVYYNLAEIRRFQEKCDEAILLYERYLALSPNAADRKAIEKSIKECAQKVGATAPLAVKVTGPPDALIILNGIPVATGLAYTANVPPGRWEVAVTAPDWEPHRAAVNLPAEGGTFNADLKERTFFGELAVVVNVDGADVYVDSNPVGASPVKGVKLNAGKHFLEVKKPGYHPWVRNVVIPRDDIHSVSVNLEKLDSP